MISELGTRLVRTLYPNIWRFPKPTVNDTDIVSSTRIQNSPSQAVANYALQIHDKYLSPSAFALSGTTMDENHLLPEFKPELSVKPVIKELARTQVCFPNAKLLVDRISIVTLPATKESTETKAFRLYLTDGDWTIQGNLSLSVRYFSSSTDESSV